MDTYEETVFLQTYSYKVELDGSVNRYATNSMIRAFGEAMEGSEKDDYIVPCSLNVMNSIACAIFAHKHGRLNLLLFKDGSYIERNHIL